MCSMTNAEQVDILDEYTDYIDPDAVVMDFEVTWEDDQGYPLGCSCACECCGCNLLCEESQYMFEDDEEEDE